MGADQDDSVTHNGTNTVWTHTTGDLTFDNTLVTGTTAMQLGTDTSATSFEVLNNTGTAIFTVDGAGTITMPGPAALADDIQLRFGAVPDATMEWVSATDDMLFDLPTVLGQYRFKLGNDATTSLLQIENNTGTVVATFNAAGGITIGGDAGTEAVNIATGASAKAITIGNAASASLALEAGVGAFSVLADTTIDLDGAGAVSLESSGAAINVGADAVAQAVNIATGAAARVVTIGNAASASLALDAGVGAFSVLADTTAAITSGTAMTLTATTGGIDLDSVGATEAVYATLGTDTSATEFAVRDNSEARHFIVDGAGDLTIGGTTGATITTAGKVVRAGSATSTGLVTTQEGTSATEGWQTVVYEDTVSPSAVETALFTIPAGSIVDGVWANVETALTGGSTTVSWSIGITGDVDSFGTATGDDFTTAGDDLTQDSKWTGIAGVTPLAAAGASIGLFDASAVALKLIASATGGTAAGDTALTAGSVRIRVAYRTALPMDNA